MPSRRGEQGWRGRFERHRFLVLLGVNLILCAAIAGCVEIALRWFPPLWLADRVARLEATSSDNGFGSDEIWKVVRQQGRFVSFIPETHFKVRHGEFHATATIDELGARRVLPGRSARPIVGCLGDSFTFGVGVADDQTYVSRLQEPLDCRLVNLGVPGAALPQERWIVEHRHEELGRPPLYVLFFFLGNDFDDMIRTRRNAYATEPDQPNHPVFRQEETPAWRLNSLANRSFLRRSYAFQVLKRGAMSLTKTDFPRDEVFRIMDVRDKAYQEEAWSCLEAELDAFQALASRMSFKLLVVFVPDRHQTSARRRTMQARYYRLDEKDLDPTCLNRLLAAALRRRGIPYINPTACLQNAADADGFYYVNDNHFTALGHAAFAKAVAGPLSARIRESLPPGGAP